MKLGERYGRYLSPIYVMKLSSMLWSWEFLQLARRNTVSTDAPHVENLRWSSRIRSQNYLLEESMQQRWEHFGKGSFEIWWFFPEYPYPPHFLTIMLQECTLHEGWIRVADRLALIPLLCDAWVNHIPLKLFYVLMSHNGGSGGIICDHNL